MKSSFLFNIILLITLNLIVKPIYIFGIELKVQNVLGEEAYGSYFEILSLVFIFNIINDLGINVYNTRIISQNIQLAQQQFKQLVSLKLSLGLLFLAVLSLFFYLLAYDTEVYYLLVLVAIVYILTSFFMFIRSNLSGLAMYKKDSVISVVDRLILITIMAYILYYNPLDDFKIEYFLYAQIASLIIAIVIGRILLKGHIGGIGINFSNSFNKDFLNKSLPYAIVFILMTIYSRMDGVMLGRILDDNGREAGIYAAGYRLFDAGSMFAYLFAALLLPMYVRLLKNKLELQSLSELAFKLIWVYVILVAYIFLFYSTEISTFLYIEGDDYYGKVLLLLMGSLIAIAVSYIYGTIIVAKGSMQQLNWIFIFCIILNFILNYILIPEYKALGAAISTLITQFIAMIGQVVVCHRIIKLNYNYKLYFYSILFMMISGFSFYIIDSLISDWWISMGINIILSLIIAFLMKMIDFGLFITMIKSKTEAHQNDS